MLKLFQHLVGSLLVTLQVKWNHEDVTWRTLNAVGARNTFPARISLYAWWSWWSRWSRVASQNALREVLRHGGSIVIGGGEILTIRSVVIQAQSGVHGFVITAAHVLEMRCGQYGGVWQLLVTVRHEGLAVVESCLGTRD